MVQETHSTSSGQARQCQNCNKNYNIVKSELDFYHREHIPIPRLCPDCRYYNRIALRPPRKLWHRQCMCDGSAISPQARNHPHHTGKCPNEFETTYRPNRPEIVYCEECYRQEVV